MVCRMKIDIDDIGNDRPDRAANSGAVMPTCAIGTDNDGTVTCATVRPAGRRIVE
ncbi:MULTISPECIES: DUF5990 family protein [Hyphomicrobiales]|uniref:DUF5990 family protein n=1 Tax=Hyphomicrobiales TaxID=356 RepID=UPI00372BDB4D